MPPLPPPSYLRVRKYNPPLPPPLYPKVRSESEGTSSGRRRQHWRATDLPFHTRPTQQSRRSSSDCSAPWSNPLFRLSDSSWRWTHRDADDFANRPRSSRCWLRRSSSACFRTTCRVESRCPGTWESVAHSQHKDLTIPSVSKSAPACLDRCQGHRTQWSRTHRLSSSRRASPYSRTFPSVVLLSIRETLENAWQRLERPPAYTEPRSCRRTAAEWERKDRRTHLWQSRRAGGSPRVEGDRVGSSRVRSLSEQSLAVREDTPVTDWLDTRAMQKTS